MKPSLKHLILLLVATLWLNVWGQDFNKYFSDSTLRIDYILSGNLQSQSISIDGMSRMPGWYGKRQNLTSFPVHGAATIDMRLAATGELIYRHTFSTLFQEWLDLDDARLAPKAFECVELLPMPHDSVVVTVNLYNHRQEVIASIEHNVYPTDCTIVRKGERNVPDFVVLNEPANPDKAINIAFVAEGYTQEQLDDYLEDCRKGVDGIFKFEPFKHLRDRFRVIAVLSPSQDCGPSIPSEGVWHNTAIGSSFDTFGMARYLTTLRIKQMHDAMAGTPYEHIIVMVNTDRYGGGGIYNTLNLLMTKHKLFIEVLVHEFGHSFAGLADEYAYEGEEPNDFPLDVEPWSPNITTLTDFPSKWKDMMPGKKAIISTTDDKNLDTSTIGLYEGAGCVLKGVYRPTPNCMMKTLKVPIFCPVCNKAIEDIINFYTK
ncbi:MAG: peptidase M64 [Muribaculaceae bacterium]|nr:peptidase M64 [Muribaculaceae bacterium]MBR6489720.1 peptidase M64 [Muribaculaceae bacterium]